jgi:hypothetical protein
MKYETTLVRHLFPLIVLSSAVTITAFAQSDISGPAPAIVAGDLDAELGELDAETRRFQAEVARLDVRDNVRRTWVYAFKISTPENRANIWQELEQARQQPDADLSEVDGLVEIFAPATPVIRQVYWTEVNKRLGSGQ